MITGSDVGRDGAVMREYWSLAASLEHPTLYDIRDNKGWSQLSTPPTDVTFEAFSKSGVNGVMITPENARRDVLLLCLHGGGFISGSSASHGPMYAHLAKAVGCQALVLDYPLAPEEPFPAAPDACLLAYGLLSAGPDAPRIILVGDSAGGNLALSTCQRASQIDASQPIAVILLSPWVDLSLASPSLEANQSVDPFFNTTRLSALLGAYLQAAEDPSGPLVSPIFGDLANLPPIYVQVGGAEGLRDDGVRLAAACRHAGTAAECNVYEAMPHVFQAAVGRDALAGRAIAEAAAWINALSVMQAR
jgi:acetyl esterase/lipase